MDANQIPSEIERLFVELMQESNFPKNIHPVDKQGRDVLIREAASILRAFDLAGFGEQSISKSDVTPEVYFENRISTMREFLSKIKKLYPEG